MTDTDTEEIILEPGDPGYEDPSLRASRDVEEPVPPPQDLQHTPLPGESEAEFMARTQNVVVDSQHPADVVPNVPQITMGERVLVEGSDPPLYTTSPEPEPEPEEEPEPEPEEEPEA